MDTHKFEHYVDEAISSLPAAFREKLDNVAVVVEDMPSQYQAARLKLRGRILLLGLYEGVPKTKRGAGYGVGGTLPDKITIFKNAILAISRTRENVIHQIRKTVLHEIGHHFGMSEEEIRRAEYT